MSSLSAAENEIRDFIVSEIAHGAPPVPITRDLNLVDNEIVDSLAIFALVEYLERRFGFVLQPEDIVIGNFESVGAIRALVALRAGAAAG